MRYTNPRVLTGFIFSDEAINMKTFFSKKEHLPKRPLSSRVYFGKANTKADKSTQKNNNEIPKIEYNFDN